MQKYNLKLFIFICLIVSLNSFCLADHYNKNKIIWKGCGITKKAFMQEAAKEYQKETGREITLVGGGATLGIRSTLSDITDIGGTCRPNLPNTFPEDEKGGFLTHVAWDAIVFITHPSNPVKNITSQEIKDIYLGKITNWNQLSGPDKKIILIYRTQTEEGKYSGVGYMLRKMLFKDANIDFTNLALNFRDSGLVEQAIETTPWSFAATGISSAKKRAVNIFNLDNIEPSKENIASGEYKLFRPLYLITHDIPTGNTKLFLDWLLSIKGQTVISNQGTVNLSEGKLLNEKFQYWENTESILNFYKK